MTLVKQEKLLGLKEVESKTNRRHTNIYDLMKKDHFPKSRKIKGKNCWRESEIDQWIAAQWEISEPYRSESSIVV